MNDKVSIGEKYKDLMSGRVYEVVQIHPGNDEYGLLANPSTHITYWITKKNFKDYYFELIIDEH